jgi:cell filamentation protein
LVGAAHTLVDLNAVHPFREGNGRAQRALLSLLGRAAGWPIDWTGLDRDANIEASHSGHSGNELPMLELLSGLVAPAQLSLGIDDLFSLDPP